MHPREAGPSTEPGRYGWVLRASDGCVVLSSSASDVQDEQRAVWPYGATARDDAAGVMITDRDGRVIAQPGVRFTGGGAYVQLTQLDALSTTDFLKVVDATCLDGGPTGDVAFINPA